MRYPQILFKCERGVIYRTRRGLHIWPHFWHTRPIWMGIYPIVHALEALTPAEVAAHGLDPVSHGELIAECRQFARQQHANWRAVQGFRRTAKQSTYLCALSVL